MHSAPIHAHALSTCSRPCTQHLFTPYPSQYTTHEQVKHACKAQCQSEGACKIQISTKVRVRVPESEHGTISESRTKEQERRTSPPTLQKVAGVRTVDLQQNVLPTQPRLARRDRAVAALAVRTSRLAAWGCCRMAQDSALWRSLSDSAKPAVLSLLSCCAQRRHTPRGYAPCNSDSDTAVGQVVHPTRMLCWPGSAVGPNHIVYPPPV
eukprot:353700-Chlamydomonas_euryale.AAC.5